MSAAVAVVVVSEGEEATSAMINLELAPLSLSLSNFIVVSYLCLNEKNVTMIVARLSSWLLLCKLDVVLLVWLFAVSLVSAFI